MPEEIYYVVIFSSAPTYLAGLWGFLISAETSKWVRSTPDVPLYQNTVRSPSLSGNGHNSSSSSSSAQDFLPFLSPAVALESHCSRLPPDYADSISTEEVALLSDSAEAAATSTAAAAVATIPPDPVGTSDRKQGRGGETGETLDSSAQTGDVVSVVSEDADIQNHQ
ncbi:hypothetical protein DPEC_G00321040 [Dallia pectoralis]|uniref:Uncharacterized protein n=1 Tax=Dallia pectoralis TaxID=75939 RepID=A0ACC2FA67_DALPE|nr:hypothetical protein DPEC_G00321040 [Dallia pectoralis]